MPVSQRGRGSSSHKTIGRALPTSLEAEKSVLSAVLLNDEKESYQKQYDNNTNTRQR